MATRPKRFRASAQPSPQQQAIAYDRRRGSAKDRGYNHRWAKASATHRLHHPLCLGCKAAGLIVAAELVDHVEPHKGDSAKFWDTSRWQSSCRWHHDVVKQRLELMWARGAISSADLWLDSVVALRLAAQLREG